MRLALVIFILAILPATASPPTMQVDGEPFFPLGWYTSNPCFTVQAARDWMAPMQAQGMNSALICYGVEDYDVAMTSYLEAGGQVGMKIMVEVNRNAVMELEGYPLSLIDSQVDLCKDYPAFLAWYLMDEPEHWGVTPAMLQARYTQIKARDPAHDIVVCHGTCSNYNPAITYLNAEPPPYTDDLMPYNYVVRPNTPEFGVDLWDVTWAAQADVQLSQSHNKGAVVEVLQAHQWSDLRLPTYAEQRYQSYGPVTVGARAIYYWMYYDVYSPESYRTTVIGPIAREIASLIPAILSNSTSAAVTSNRDTDTTGHGVPDVTYLIGEDDHAAYLLAVNNTASTISTTLTLGGTIYYGPSPANVPVMFESRSVTPQPIVGDRWTITETFNPYDVNVYQLYVKDATVAVDLGSPDAQDGIAPVTNDDGGTVALDHAAVNCRRNDDPNGSPADTYFYFNVSDAFAYQGSNPDLYITIRYYDSAAGSLELQYDAAGLPYKSGGTVALTGGNIWKLHTFHVTDAYFGNRQSSGADFRIYGGVGATFYLDRVSVEPAIQVTSDKPNGLYKTAEPIDIQVKFQVPVFVTGTPRLELETGAVDQVLDYVSGSGTDTLVFSYTVVGGDSVADLDYTSSDSLTLNGGAIKDAGGSDVALTLPAPGAGGSLASSKNLVIDTTPTTVLDITSSNPDGIYKASDVITIRMTCQTPVFVTGAPQLELETGAIDRMADYVSGSGTDTLVFSYTVVGGDSAADLDCTGADALNMNGGSIKDSGGVDIDPDVPSPGAWGSLGFNKNLVIDTTAPTVSNVTSTRADGTCKIGDVISVQVAFSEPVYVAGSPRLQLETGATDRQAVYSSGSGTGTLTFSYVVVGGDSAADLDYTSTGAFTLNGGTIRDAVGNDAILTLPAPGAPGSLGYNKNIVVDGVRATVVNVTSPKPDGAYKAAEVIDINVTFAEPVNVTGIPLLELETGAVDRKPGYISGTGSAALTFRYTVQPGDTSADLGYKATNSLTGTIKDLAGNSATLALPAPGSPGSLNYNKALVIDTTAPVSTANPAGGVYSGTKSVALSANESAAIHYTTDDSEPGPGSSVYSIPIELASDTTLRFYAVDAAGNDESPKKLEVYTIITDNGSIALVKQLLDGETVRLGNKPLYLKWPGFAYIEEPERFAGIRVEGALTALQGERVCLIGTIQKPEGEEPYIQVTAMTANGPAGAKPLGANNRMVAMGLVDGIFTTTWGRVKPGSITSNSYVITDGSDDVGIRVVTQAAPTVNAGDFVVITGAPGVDGGRVLYEYVSSSP